MHIHTFVTHLTLHLRARSNTNGNLATRTLNQSKCGHGSVGHGSLDLKTFWREVFRSNGMILLMLVIGAYIIFPWRPQKLTAYQHRLVFRWLAIPWLQREADSYVYDHNTTRRRANRRKVLPNGIPDVMFEYPETVDALDFKVCQYYNTI
jgi:hypothetical protein